MRQISAMYRDACPDPTTPMTSDDFAMTCMKYKLLASSAAKARLSAGIDGIEDKTHDAVMEELSAKWQARADEMMDRISQVLDSGVRGMLHARVSRHTEVCDGYLLSAIQSAHHL